MDTGWIKLHRKIFENKLWFSEPFTKSQAWIDLFANANHQPNSFWVRGNEVKLEVGQLGWSELTMAKRWKWSRDKVRRFLSYLTSESNIRQHKTPITSIITIVNYERYQDTRQQKNIKQDNKQYTNKNDKNDKKEDIESDKSLNTPKNTNIKFFEMVGNKGIEYDEFIRKLVLATKISDTKIKDEIRKFTEYWTELNSTGTKQRWEKEKVFEIKRRLTTWLNNNNKWESKDNKTKKIWI
jgi:hypothetical protein